MGSWCSTCIGRKDGDGVAERPASKKLSPEIRSSTTNNEQPIQQASEANHDLVAGVSPEVAPQEDPKPQPKPIQSKKWIPADFAKKIGFVTSEAES